MNDNTGWIKLHRKILDCWIWQDKPYDKARAWVDLLLLAMHHDKKMMLYNELICVEQGSYMTSILKLCDRWGWSRNKVNRFLDVLESEHMVYTKRTPKGTLITIVKYKDYQLSDFRQGTTDDTANDTTNGSTNEPQNKNVKNVKNEKNNIYVCSFEELWKIYPRKINKGAAYKCYMARLRSGYSEEELLLATKNYAEECKREHTEPKYIKHATTFFSATTPFIDYLKGDNSNGFTGRDDSETESDSYADQLEHLLGEDMS